MHKIIRTCGAVVLGICCAFLPAEAFAAGITIGTGASVTLSGSSTVTTVDINNSGAFSGGAGTVNISGNWTNSGTFNAGTGTFGVVGAGTSTINGTNTFYNFSCLAPAKSITFIAATTQNISNNFTLTGAASNRITLRSSATGTQWKINPQGAVSVDFVDVKDSNNINITAITPSGTLDSGNNPGWIFGSLAFTSAQQTIITNVESAPFTFKINYANNNSAQRDITVNLASSSIGTYQFRAVSGGASVTFVTIPNGSINSQFYYIDNKASAPALTISATGYSQAQQLVTITAISYELTVTSPQIAGSEFTLIITAKDDTGATFITYAGTADLTVNYVTPAIGTGALGAASTSAFVNGAATITNQTFSDCGTITITAADRAHPTITGTSPKVDFRPFDFTVAASTTDSSATAGTDARQVVNKPFTLTVTARNAQAATCPNYIGTAALSINYITPTVNQSGALSTSSLDSITWSNGIAAITTETYNKWGTITVTATDGTLTTQKGTSANIVFIPSGFTVSPSAPPPARTFYYTNENFSAGVTANDFNNAAISNYQGTIAFVGNGLSVPGNYTFAAADSGSHTFTGISGSEETAATLGVNDTTFASITGVSSSIIVKFAKIVVISTTGPVGPVVVQIQVVDSKGNIITSDNSTKFTVKITEFIKDGSTVSSATSQDVTVTGGVANVTISDSQAETITVSATSSPGLTAVAGTIRFGTVSGGGVGIQFWRELRGGGTEETTTE